MRAEERTDGHSGPEFCLDGADFRVFCRRVHIEAMHLDRHAATPSHAHDDEATEGLILNRVYGKLADWVCDGSGALLATACRTEVSNSDGTVRVNNQHSRGLTVGHAAHAVDFNRRPILSRQNVLALFRIPTASTNRAAELHEYQRSGFDDGEPFAVVQGYGMLSAGKYEFLPCFLHVLEDAQIGLEVIPCGGLDVGVSELSCDHADVGSGLDRQRAERVA